MTRPAMTVAKRLLPLLLLAAPASAQPPQAVMPNRDVTIVYRLSGDAANAIPGGTPGNVRVDWRAADRRLRVESDGGREILLVDLNAPSVHLIQPNLRAAMVLPVRGRDLQPLTLEGVHLTRKGKATIAGLACTDYAAQSSRGRGTVCLTDDGVALRANGEVDGHPGALTAVSVAFDPVPATAFEVPQGYFQMPIPARLPTR